MNDYFIYKLHTYLHKMYKLPKLIINMFCVNFVKVFKKNIDRMEKKTIVTQEFNNDTISEISFLLRKKQIALLLPNVITYTLIKNIYGEEIKERTLTHQSVKTVVLKNS